MRKKIRLPKIILYFISLSFLKLMGEVKPLTFNMVIDAIIYWATQELRSFIFFIISYFILLIKYILLIILLSWYN